MWVISQYGKISQYTIYDCSNSDSCSICRWNSHNFFQTKRIRLRDSHTVLYNMHARSLGYDIIWCNEKIFICSKSWRNSNDNITNNLHHSNILLLHIYDLILMGTVRSCYLNQYYLHFEYGDLWFLDCFTLWRGI